MEKRKRRFAGVIGKDYELFQMAVAHNFQDDLENFLREFTSNIEGEKIEVLEIGTGTGITTAHILEANDHSYVTTVDNEEVVSNQAKENLKEDKSKINFVFEDALEFLRGAEELSFYAFVSAYTIHNFSPEYRKKLFPEIFRVLKSGGIFINADKYGYEDLKLHKKYFDKQMKAFDIYDTVGRSDVKKEWREHYIEDDKIKITGKEQIDILNEIGFIESEIVFRKDMEAIIRAYKPEN